MLEVAELGKSLGLPINARRNCETQMVRRSPSNLRGGSMSRSASAFPL